MQPNGIGLDDCMREWITGRNAAYEVLKMQRRDLFEVRISQTAKLDAKLSEIILMARKRKIEPHQVQRKQLDQLDENHQGLAIEVSGYHYADITEILDAAKQKDEPLFILILDIIQNPQNLGTLIRTAAAAGVHGVIVPQARAAGVTPAVVHASVGATEHMLISQMNLSQAIDIVHEAGAWVIGLEGAPGTAMIRPEHLTGNLTIVVGSEGEGLRQLTRKACDELAALPMTGEIESLNAATAGSIAVYLAYLERIKKRGS